MLPILDVHCGATSRYLAVLIRSSPTPQQPDEPDDIERQLAKAQQLFSISDVITSMLSYSQLETRLSRSLFSPNPDTDSLTIIIQGQFTSKDVKVNDQITIRYGDLIDTHSRMLQNRRLRLWLIGPGSHVWIDRCIAAYDFHIFQITAYDKGFWLYIGAEQLPLESSALQLKVLKESRKVEETEIEIYSFEEQSYANYTIVNIANVTHVFINFTTNQTYIKCDHGFPSLFGTLVAFDTILCQITVRNWMTLIRITETRITVSNVNRNQVKSYDFIKDTFYIGPTDQNGDFHGLGFFVNPQIRKIGLFKSSVLQGMTNIVHSGHSKENKLEAIALNRRKSFFKSIKEFRIFRGMFVDNKKSFGTFKDGGTVMIGYSRDCSRPTCGRFHMLTSDWGLSRYYRLGHSSVLSYGTGFFQDRFLLHGERRTEENQFRGKFHQQSWPNKGMFKFVNGSYCFTTSMNYGRANDMGSCYYNSAEYFIGFFVESFENGNAVMVGGGVRYLGHMEHGVKQGFGKQIFGKEKWREGIFYSDKFARGVQYENGKVTEGLVLNGNDLSSETIVIENGTVYEGRKDFEILATLQTDNCTDPQNVKRQLGAGLFANYGQSQL